MSNALASAAAAGMAARTVDVVAHSMGGLVTRYFLSTSGYTANPALLPNPVHQLITIGTPHSGTPFATALANNQNQTLALQNADPEEQAICQASLSCQQGITLGGMMGLLGKNIDTAVQSMEPGSLQLKALSPSNVFSAIVGTAPILLSATEAGLDAVLSGFLPGQTVASIVGQPNDTIVPAASETGGEPICAVGVGLACAMTIPDLVSYDPLRRLPRHR